MIPPALDRLATAPLEDMLLSCPGLVYRRDRIDRYSVGEPHQVDLWRIRTATPALTGADLLQMISVVVEAALPGAGWRTTAAQHPYTTGGLQIDAQTDDTWVEIGECGLAHARLLAQSGLDPAHVSGLAMGLGLDRLVMLRKGLDDIRLLRSTDPRVAQQMRDLEPYRPVSSMPAVRRDLSIVVGDAVVAEELGDRVRSALGERAQAVESVEVLTDTPSEALPAGARVRLGIRPGQRNVLVRVVLRDLERTLTAQEANALRDQIYAVLHEGPVHEWAGGGPCRRLIEA
jgi:phenylalanyl-tRNA synthetase alpha chain